MQDDKEKADSELCIAMTDGEKRRQERALEQQAEKERFDAEKKTAYEALGVMVDHINANMKRANEMTLELADVTHAYRRAALALEMDRTPETYAVTCEAADRVHKLEMERLSQNRVIAEQINEYETAEAEFQEKYNRLGGGGLDWLGIGAYMMGALWKSIVPTKAP